MLSTGLDRDQLEVHIEALVNQVSFTSDSRPRLRWVQDHDRQIWFETKTMCLSLYWLREIEKDDFWRQRIFNIISIFWKVVKTIYSYEHRFALFWEQIFQDQLTQDRLKSPDETKTIKHWSGVRSTSLLVWMKLPQVLTGEWMSSSSSTEQRSHCSRVRALCMIFLTIFSRSVCSSNRSFTTSSKALGGWRGGNGGQYSPAMDHTRELWLGLCDIYEYYIYRDLRLDMKILDIVIIMVVTLCL